MPLPFRRNPDLDDPFRRNEAVMATTSLPGVPEGTKGKVKLINGFAWTRYWVFFDNGVKLGSIDHEKLVRPHHWQQFHLRSQERAEAEARAAEAAAAAAEAGEAAPAAVAAGDGSDPKAAMRARIPAHLLERTAARRAALGVPAA